MLNKAVIILILSGLQIITAHGQTSEKRQKAIDLTGRGLQLYAKDNTDSALYFFNLALKKDSTYTEARFRRGLIYKEIKDYRKAYKDFIWFFNYVHDPSAEQLENLAEMASKNNNPYLARKCFTLALLKDSTHGDYYAHAGLFYFAPDTLNFKLQPDYNTAAEMLEKAVSLNYTSAEIYSRLAYAYMRLNENKKAVFYFSKAIDADPKNVEEYANRGNALLAIHQLEAAKDDFYYYMKYDSADPSVWYNLARAQYGLNEYDASIISLKKVLELQPGFEDTWFRLGLTYGDQGEYKKAIEAFNEAIKQSPGAGYIYYNRAVAKAKSDPKSDYCSDLKVAADMGYADAIKMQSKVCKP
jgi:tetratricopeptide (TPR) repeat protein